MKVVNLGDNYTHRITLRLTDDQFEFCVNASKVFGCTPSGYIRKLIDSNLARGAASSEYVKADKHDKL